MNYCEDCKYWIDGICMEKPILRVITAPGFSCGDFVKTDDEDDL